MSNIALNCPIFDAISQRTTQLSCFNLNNCHYKLQYRVMKQKVSDDEIRDFLARAGRRSGKEVCTRFCGYQEDLFYSNEDNMLRLPHDTEETLIEGVSPEKMRKVSDQHVGKAVIYLREHWSEIVPLLERNTTLVFRKGLARAADSHDNAIDNLMQLPDERAMVNELSEGTALYVFICTFVRDGSIGTEGQVFFLHKTPTVCALVRCHTDGYCINSSLFMRTSPDDPWIDQEPHSEGYPANPEEFHQLCAEFYGLFVSMQQMEDDFSSFSRQLSPGAFLKYGLDKYQSYAKFPIRMFCGY